VTRSDPNGFPLRAALTERLEEHYGLSWPGKGRAAALADTPPSGVLRPRPTESVNWEATRNLMIEGDNLEVLKLLRETDSETVSLMYIDPPYNTGNDFVYSDRFRGARRDHRQPAAHLHSAWLNMVYPRLLVARDLLRDDGVLAVSIDEHESHNLRHLLDEVLGPENFIAELCVSLNPKGRQLTRFFATAHEYVTLYAKNVATCALQASCASLVDRRDFPRSDDRGRHRLLPLRNTNKKFNPTTRPNLYFPLHVDRAAGTVSTVSGPSTVEIYPVFGDGNPAVWRWSRSKVARQSDELLGRRVRGRLGERTDVFQKDYLGTGRKKKLKSIWLSDRIGSTDVAVEELKGLIGPVFQTPKPTALIRALIRLMPPDARVLDFFAGSGTTGHAVMAQNAADGGSRRYILVQLPEPLRVECAEQRAGRELCERLGRPANIAELTKERLRRAARAIAEEHTRCAADLGFRVFELDRPGQHQGNV